MKNFRINIFYLLIIALSSSSCSDNKKLDQTNAESTIKEFILNNSFSGDGSWGEQSSFDVNSISSIEPIIQFNETEASSVVHFNYHDAFAEGNLNLKFNFKRDINKNWILTSVDAISGVGSQGMSDRLQRWQNLNIMVSPPKKNKSKNKIILFLKKEVIDIDGNVYHTVKIGKQVWMLENLKTTKFNDGSSIPNVINGNEWINLNTPGYCWYNNDISNKDTYGALYNWYAANSGNLAPEGWHVASNAEIDTLINFLGGNNVAGGKLKESDLTHWLNPNKGATNETGFTALPGGVRFSYRVKEGTADGTFYNIGKHGYLWTSTHCSSGLEGSGYSLEMRNDSASIGNYCYTKSFGFSVRCIKD